MFAKCPSFACTSAAKILSKKLNTYRLLFIFVGLLFTLNHRKFPKPAMYSGVGTLMTKRILVCFKRLYVTGSVGPSPSEQLGRLSRQLRLSAFPSGDLSTSIRPRSRSDHFIRFMNKNYTYRTPH